MNKNEKTNEDSERKDIGNLRYGIGNHRDRLVIAAITSLTFIGGLAYYTVMLSNTVGVLSAVIACVSVFVVASVYSFVNASEAAVRAYNQGLTDFESVLRDKSQPTSQAKSIRDFMDTMMKHGTTSDKSDDLPDGVQVVSMDVDDIPPEMLSFLRSMSESSQSASSKPSKPNLRIVKDDENDETDKE